MTTASDRPERQRRLLDGRFALFADCLYLGCMVVVASLPVLTAFAAFTAACRVLRERVRHDATITVRSYATAYRAVLTSHVGVVLAPLAAIIVLTADVVAVRSGIPGAPGVEVLTAASAVTAVVLTMRAAALWSPELPWRQVVLSAALATLHRPRGSLMLLAGAAAAGVIGQMSLPTLLLVPGPLVLAAVAITHAEEE